jgi:hypothetical protein
MTAEWTLPVLPWLATIAGCVLLQNYSKRMLCTDDTINNFELLVVTRLHGSNASKLPPAQRLIDFIESAKLYANGILICAEGFDRDDAREAVLESYRDAISSYRSIAIEILEIRPWGHFTTALNQAIFRAQDKGFRIVAFQVSSLIVGAVH